MRPRRVAYLWSEDMQAAADQLPSNLGRSSVVHDLIRDLDLLDNGGVPRDLERDGRQGDAGRRSGGVGARGDLLRARVVRPDIQLGNEDNMKRYHDPKYVGPFMRGLRLCDLPAHNLEYLMNPTTHRNKGDDVGTDSDSDGYSTDMTGDSNDSYTRSERPAKRRRTEHGLEHVRRADASSSTDNAGLSVFPSSTSIRRTHRCRGADCLSGAPCWHGGCRGMLGWRKTPCDAEPGERFLLCRRCRLGDHGLGEERAASAVTGCSVSTGNGGQR